MGMRLEDDGAGSDDCSTLAPQVARRAALIEATMGSGQRRKTGQGTLPRSLSGSVRIDDQPLVSCPVDHPTGGSKRFPGHQVLLKELAEGLHTRLVKGSEKAGKGRTMSQEMTAKERHETVGN